jgi:alkanesulfonate monooxygenase SsuD/methylene tetrahydromethanopterin reductase-like flavin-dependent oxidoreductase (luciferase family)
MLETSQLRGRRVKWTGCELAGRRFADIDLHALVQWHEITDDRRAAAERASAALGVTVEDAIDSPYVLVGTADEVAEQLRAHRASLGITRWTIFGDRPDLAAADALVPVLELLAES